MNNAEGNRICVGAQTIPWGETIRENLPAILRTLRGLGYEGAEIGVRHFDWSKPGYYRELFDETGVSPVAAHTGGTFWDEAQARREMAGTGDAIRFAAEVGFTYFALSGNRGETPESMKTAAAAYNRIGAECRERGLQLIYHNHDWEFADESATLKVLLDTTSEDNVKLLPDLAWIHRAGLDPVAFLGGHRHRIGYAHFKDWNGTDFCELGTGAVALGDALEAYAALDCDWLIVEQDTTTSTPEDSLRVSAEWLRGAGAL